MSRFVESGGKLLPASWFEPLDDLPPGVCGWCGGTGLTHEQIDEERFDVVVKCQACQMYCQACRQWVKRKGHQCGI